MHFRELDRGELIAVVGGIILAISLLLPWFTLGNGHALLNSCRGPNTTCTGWHSFMYLRYLLLLGSVAPLILTWIILRGHGLSWPRGELTAITAILMLVLIVFRGLIDKPGAPRSEFSIDYGFFVALAGALVILVGSLWRAQEGAERRKPPGVL
jgi:hypothetical protein